MHILEVNNVSKQFATHKALDDVSLRVEKGKIFGLLGPNGAGKTTLIRIINQITGPDQGEVLFNGTPLAPNHISRIGYLPEERGLYKKMKIGEQVIYLAQLKGMTKVEATKKIKFWFEKMGMETWWNKKVEELSKGMQQKVQFVATVMHEPELIILDEPFTGFDPVNTELIKKEILELRDRGTSVIFSTHRMESVEEICDDIALINKSKNVLAGTVAEIKEQYKTNTFDILYEGNTDDLKGALDRTYDNLGETTIGKLKNIRIKISDRGNLNILLENLIPVVTLHGANEVIPSLNQIFIQTVNDLNK